jgi:predicted nucleotidyltransferase
MVLEMHGAFISFQLMNIPEEIIPVACDQMADVRLGAKTVYLMNTILLYSKELSMEFSRQKALDEFVKRASEAYGDRIHGITLFGSVARGTARPDSDIDLLVVVDKEDFRLRRELIGMAFDMLLETGEDISVKVLSQKDFEARKGFSFLRNVISEGVKIA